MRFAISSEQASFFKKYHYIEFEALFSLEEMKEVAEEGEKLLATKLKIPPGELSKKKSFELFKEARDLVRLNFPLKKILLNSKLTELAASLFRETPLRLAYDLFFYTSSTGFCEEFPMIKGKHALQQISSFNKVLGGLVVRLTEGESFSPLSSSTFCPLPKKAGSGLFFRSDLPFSLEEIFQIPNQRFFLLVYCPERTLYTLEKKDLHTHSLKKEGYVFGDLLKENTHPLLYR